MWCQNHHIKWAFLFGIEHVKKTLHNRQLDGIPISHPLCHASCCHSIVRCRLRHKGMTNTQNSRVGGGAQGGSSCHQAKWTVNIFTVRVISSSDLFQQGLPEGSLHWPPGMSGLMHTLKQSLLPSTGFSKLKEASCFLHYESIPAQTGRSDCTRNMLNSLIWKDPIAVILVCFWKHF